MAPFAGAFVDRFNDRAVGQDLRLRRQRPVHAQALLAMHDHQIINARFGHPARAPGRHGGKARHDLQAVFIDKAQFIRVQRVGPHADSQRIEHHLAIAISEGLVLLF
jgi:hypothetical protein